MHIKTLLLSSFALLTAGTAIAQDKMYKRNGDILEVKVKEVSNKEISYKRASNADGPTYIIGKNEVERIEYENGSEDVFVRERGGRMQGEREESNRPKLKYGRNIIALAPLQITEGVGLGLSYERVLDKRGILSLYIPAAVAFNGNNSGGEFFPGGYYNNYGPYNENYNTYYIMPGLKIYPTGSKGKIRYAVGPSFALVFGQQYNYYYYNTYPYTSTPVYKMEDRFAFGMMINNSLNMQPTPHLYLGLELGLGVTYIQKVGGVDVGTNTLGQFAFKIGYRF